MANLVMLNLDKDTGKIVASGATSGAVVGFAFQQVTPTLTWTIVHNIGNTQLICQVYNSSNQLIIPDIITIVDTNTVQITFLAPQAGAAHIIFFG